MSQGCGSSRSQKGRSQFFPGAFCGTSPAPILILAL